MRLRWDDYTFYNGKETMLYRDGVINQLVIPINNKDMMDDKCIKDQWGYYIRPVTPDEIGDIYSVRPYAIYKGRKVGLMDAASAVKIMYADEIESGDATEVIAEKTAEYQNLQGSVMSAAARGYVDSIVEPVDTRKYIIGAFEMLYTKFEDRPGKKHGTV